MIEQRYFNIKELSRYLGIPQKTLYDWASCRVIPSIKIGGRIMFDLNDIDKTMVTNKRDIDAQNAKIYFFDPEEGSNSIIKRSNDGQLPKSKLKGGKDV